MHIERNAGAPASATEYPISKPHLRMNDQEIVWACSLKRFSRIAHLEIEQGNAEDAANYARMAATRAFLIHPELRIPLLGDDYELRFLAYQLMD